MSVHVWGRHSHVIAPAYSYQQFCSSDCWYHYMFATADTVTSYTAWCHGPHKYTAPNTRCRCGISDNGNGNEKSRWEFLSQWYLWQWKWKIMLGAIVVAVFLTMAMAIKIMLGAIVFAVFWTMTMPIKIMLRVIVVAVFLAMAIKSCWELLSLRYFCQWQ